MLGSYYSFLCSAKFHETLLSSAFRGSPKWCESPRDYLKVVEAYRTRNAAGRFPRRVGSTPTISVILLNKLYTKTAFHFGELFLYLSRKNLFCFYAENSNFNISSSRSAMGVKIWYFFQIRYIFASSLGARGRKTSPLSGFVSIRCSKVKR